MSRIFIILSILSLFIGLSAATTFVFGVTLKCQIDKPFKYSIQYFEYDFYFSDDVITPEYTSTAYKLTFFYQTTPPFDGDGYLDNWFELYAVVKHNCTYNGGQKEIKQGFPASLTDHGIEMFDYEINLTDREGRIDFYN